MIKRALLLTVTISILGIIVLAPSAFAVEIKRKVLPNGLVLLHSERQNLPVVTMSMIVNASPLDEPEDKAGLASLASQLLDEGTKNRTSTEISSQMEFLGASLGIGTNEDYTNVSFSVLKEDLGTGFDILADVLLNPVFPEEEIARVKSLVKDGLRQREEDPGFLASKAFRKELYGGHPYGRLVEGSPETLDKIKREDLLEFHRKYYLPNNAILSVVGDITEGELDALLAKHLNGWLPAPVPARAADALTVERLEEKRTVFVDRNLTQANIKLGNAGIRRDNPDYYAVSVMNYIFGGGGFASRLMWEIRDKRGLAYDVHSLFDAKKYKGMFQVGVQTKNESARTAIDVIKAEMARIRTEPVSKEELEDAKAYLTGSFPRRLDTMRKIADFMAGVEFYGLGLDYIDKYPDYINSVTARDVLRVAKKYINPDDYLLVVVADQARAGLKAE